MQRAVRNRCERQRSLGYTGLGGALLLGLLVGCSSPIGLSSSTIGPEQTVLSYFQWLQAASAEAVQAELNSLATIKPVNQPLQEVKRALLLSRQPTSADNEAEAIALLSAITANPPSTLPDDYLSFARLWLQLVQERRQFQQLTRQLTESEAALASVRQNQEALESRYALLREVMDTQEQQNALLAQQNALMQQQIDALTNIEQQLVELDQNTTGAVP
jgi:DNA repair exonuclease SbcCD ATPase subunit